MYLINLLAWSFLLSLTSYVYSVVLTDGGMILNPLYNWLDKTIGPSSAKKAVYYSEDTIEPRLLKAAQKARAVWLFKPLIGCHKCVAGQFAFWGYFWLLLHNLSSTTLTFCEKIVFAWYAYDLVFHIVFISFAIYTLKFIAQFYEWK
jgi:hypothetical protein